MNLKKISVLGSTGSIGTQTLDIIDRDKSFYAVCLTGNKNVALMEQQARKFGPQLCAMADEAAAGDLRVRLADTPVTVFGGAEGVKHAASLLGTDLVVSAIVGLAGLAPTLAAIHAGKNVALANKETLVAAGDLVMPLAKEKGVSIIPVDSEHSAIFQCLAGAAKPERLILTASGGPFFGKTKDELKDVTPDEALSHPNWEMGAKVTIDSATLMNKALEVMEAAHLFGMDEKNIDVLVHRQSVVHSMVQFCDNSVLAQLGAADMRTPISYALNYPNRGNISGDKLDFSVLPPLTFEAPDRDTFAALELGRRAMEAGGTMPAALNGANEAAVRLFLERKCGFLDICRLVSGAMDNHKVKSAFTLDDVYQSDRQARSWVLEHA